MKGNWSSLAVTEERTLNLVGRRTESRELRGLPVCGLSSGLCEGGAALISWADLAVNVSSPGLQLWPSVKSLNILCVNLLILKISTKRFKSGREGYISDL